MKPTRREVIEMAGYFALSAVIYFYLGRHGVAPVEVVNASWVPFLPVLALPYLLQVVVSYALIVMLSDRALRRATVKAYFAGFAVCALAWHFYPTVMYRPEILNPTWWNWPFRVMASLDMPTNIVPAGHILMPVLIIWAFAIDRPRSLWWLVPCELVGTLAIVSTWQHRPIDVVMGALLAVATGVWAGVGRLPGRAAIRSVP